MFDKIFNFLFTVKGNKDSRLTVMGKNRDLVKEENNLNAQIELKRKSICDNILQESACSRRNSIVLVNEKTNTTLSSYFDGCISLI